MINTLFDKNIITGLIGYILLPILIIAYDYYVFKNLSRAILMAVSYLAILIGISIYYKYKFNNTNNNSKLDINQSDMDNKREFGSVIINKPANTEHIIDNNDNSVNTEHIPELKENDKDILIEEFKNNNDDNSIINNNINTEHETNIANNDDYQG